MRLEERITRSLTGLDHLDTTPPRLDGVVGRGRTIKRRRTLGGVAVVVAVVLAIAGGVALPRLGEDAVEPAPPTPGQWQQLAPMPEALAGDTSLHVTHWTGEELLVMGTDAAAAYDPEADAWRELADPPVDWIGAWAADGETVVVHDGRVRQHSANAIPANVEGALWIYDAQRDTWVEWGGTWPLKTGSDISLRDRTLYVIHSDQRMRDSVQYFGLDNHGWDADVITRPGEPRIDARSVVATDEGVFVSGYEPRDPAPGDGEAPLLVERRDPYDWSVTQPGHTAAVDEWTRAAQHSPGPAMPLRHWTGDVLVGLDPLGLTLFDPDGGDQPWLPAPTPEPVAQGGWRVTGRSEGPLILSLGAVLDQRRAEWVPLKRPEGTAADAYMTGVVGDGKLYVLGGVDERSRPVTELWRLDLG